MSDPAPVTGDSYRFTEAEGIVPEAFCEAIDSLATDHDGLIALNAPIDLEAPDKDPILGS